MSTQFKLPHAAIAAAAAATLLGTSAAPAAVIANVTPTGNPPVQSAVPMTGYTGYTLTLVSDGLPITAVDVSTAAFGISGPLHQRFAFGTDENGDPVRTPTPQGASATNYDSHFLVEAAETIGVVSPFVEDNGGSGSPIADTPTSDFGTGTFLEAAFALAPAAQGTSVELAYLVVPDGQTVSVLGRASDAQGTPLPFTVVVPEPAGLGGVIALGAGLLGARRRRRPA